MAETNGKSTKKKRTRGQGEGSIAQRADGTWWARITVGRDENGKQKRKAFYGKTRKEVQEKLTAAVNEINKGTYIEPSKMTVAQWMDNWLKTYKKRSLKPSSYFTLHKLMNTHIVRAIGDIKLKDLHPETIHSLINDMSDKGLSYSVISHAYYSFKSCLTQAVDNGHIAKNPAAKAVLPMSEKKEMRVLTPEEQRIFIEVAKEMYMGELFILILATGMRIGEAIALTWDDVNFDKGLLSVNKTAVYYNDPDKKDKHEKQISRPKTKAGVRVIPILPNVLEMLKNIQQCSDNAYNLIFPNMNGEMQMPRTAAERFERIIRKTGLTNCTPHTLRHTFATRGLENGVELKVMQEILGHTSIKMTADTYMHVLPDKKKDSIMKLAQTINI